MAIKHAKTSGQPAGDDADTIYGTHWDADHTIEPGTVGLTELGSDITVAGKALLDDASAAAQRTTLGLAAIAATGSGADLTAASIEDTKLATSATKGRWLARQILTGAGTYTPTAGATRAHMRELGGGAGGGGATPGAGAGSAAGGSSGVLLDIWIGTAGVALTGGAYSCGTGGAAGSTAPGAGGTGNDTTITINATLYTAKGGGGGSAMTGVAGDSLALPTAPAAGTSAGGVTSYGLGGVGMVLGGTAWASGHGGSSPLGNGGLCVGGTTAGNAGGSYGGGGSGGSAQAGARAGGAGGNGVIVIDEYT